MELYFNLHHRCLAALQCDIGIYHVYFADVDEADPRLYTPTPEEVFDAFMTHEIWVLAPIQLKYEGKILVKRDTVNIVEMETLPGALIDKFYYKTCEWDWL